MNAAELAQSAQVDSQPPEELSLAQRALWLVRAGRWDESHDLCEEVPEPAGSWIHAYLHREEGDPGNAAYWYYRAGKEMPASGVSLDEEWQELASKLA